MLLILFVTLIFSFAALGVVMFRRWHGGWRLAAALPCVLFLGVVINIVVGTLRDRTSHNLWPMELMMWSAGGLVYLGFVYLIRRISAKR